MRIPAVVLASTLVLVAALTKRCCCAAASSGAVGVRTLSSDCPMRVDANGVGSSVNGLVTAWLAFAGSDAFLRPAGTGVSAWLAVSRASRTL